MLRETAEHFEADGERTVEHLLRFGAKWYSEREFEAAFDDGAAPDPAPDALDAFLRAVGMGQYAPNLRAEEIETIEDLALLSADDLVEAGFPRDDAAILARVVAGR